MALFIKRSKPPILLPVKEFPDNSLSFLNTEGFKQLRDFQKQWTNAENWPEQYKVLRIWWSKVCKEEMPKINAELLHTRIAYELQACAYIESKTKMPEKVAQNYKAIAAFKIEKMTQGMKQIMEILMKNQEEREMPGKSKIILSGAKKTSVSQFYLEIFEAQAQTKLTDEQIAQIIETKAGQKPTLKNVASYRCMYNAGKIQGQKTVPSAKVKAVRPKSEKPAKEKKPMSEETKAKLKTYSGKKKLTLKKKK